ncbi:helix-turn-helix transcriptional regulator [Lysinibacillus sp. NPDC094177]|uniref:helix-turn-helix transcriptional regulator n=1 Tax=Lysinibacillus sp. NPDC094177 TaxID=3390580 RepID=UPI003D00E94C
MGSKIKELRKEHNLTQTNLSLKLGVTSTYIALIEQGRRGGADKFLLKVEKFFKLKPKTLLNLRDNQISDSFQKVEHKPITNHSPDYIRLLVDALLSCGEDYVKQKVADWLKELQDDLFNRLTPYELDEVKKHVIAVTRNWVEETKSSETFEDDSHIIKGYITQDEHKHFFSLELNSCAITLNLLNKDQQKVQYFEDWLGTCSINYSLSQQLPYFQKEEEVSYYLWFNPQVSITDMYRYLKDLPTNINTMKIEEPRLNWYIHELNSKDRET